MPAPKRYETIRPDVKEKLDKELDLINRLEIPGYFLIVWDIVQYCREHDIMVQGRGSAANSVVCYSLGITMCDPIDRKLLFERFLTRGAKKCLAGHRPGFAERRQAGASHPGGLQTIWAHRGGHDGECDYLPGAQFDAGGGEGAGVYRGYAGKVFRSLCQWRFSAYPGARGSNWTWRGFLPTMRVCRL